MWFTLSGGGARGILCGNAPSRSPRVVGDFGGNASGGSTASGAQVYTGAACKAGGNAGLEGRICVRRAHRRGQRTKCLRLSGVLDLIPLLAFSVISLFLAAHNIHELTRFESCLRPCFDLISMCAE